MFTIPEMVEFERSLNDWCGEFDVHASVEECFDSDQQKRKHMNIKTRSIYEYPVSPAREVAHVAYTLLEMVGAKNIEVNFDYDSFEISWMGRLKTYEFI